MSLNTFIPFHITQKLLLLSLFLYSSYSHANEQLWQKLKDGGKVVLIRHAPVEKGPGTGNPLVRDNTCKKEKNLSEQGKRFAKELGKRFKAFNISVTKVLNSPFCRTKDTANLVFGESTPTNFLSLIEIVSQEQAEKQIRQLNQSIASHKDTGNLIMITHEPNINAVSFELIRHLDMLVLEPLGDGEYEEMGVIKFIP